MEYLIQQLARSVALQVRLFELHLIAFQSNLGLIEIYRLQTLNSA